MVETPRPPAESPLPSREGSAESRCPCASVLWTALGVGLLVWFITLGRPPGSPAVIAHYVALAAVTMAGGLLVASRWCGRSRACCTAVLAAVAARAAYSTVDRYTVTWTMVYEPARAHWVRTESPIETRSLETDHAKVKKFVDYYRRRTGELFYRTTEVHRGDRPSVLPARASGPISGGELHGHWVFTTWEPYARVDRWYWHGREVSRGRWAE